jgi:pantetheine-phosphate adenylyltransferase
VEEEEDAYNLSFSLTGEHNLCKKIALGGTFDRLHIGHRSLIDKALESGCKSIVIGVVSDKLIHSKVLSVLIKPYNIRAKRVMEYIKRKSKEPLDIIIEPLNDPYGPTINDPEIDTIVVSEETLPRAVEINMIRTEHGLKPLNIIVVEIIKAEDGRPLRATRVRLSEVDENGKLLARMLVFSVSGDPVEQNNSQ